MPIILNSVSGELDATIVDENFQELEDFLKERIEQTDFDGKFGKYKVRRFTGGKISAFNTGANVYSRPRDTAINGTFENNWVAGTPAITYLDHEGHSITALAADPSPARAVSTDIHNNGTKNDMRYSHPNQHPFELLGYPGGSMYFDFQEEGFADPVTYYDEVHSLTVDNWPPSDSPLDRFPEDECWSRWLTIPDAAGSVYVDEPCIAVITAQVQGNYFLTPALRVHGFNTSIDGFEGATAVYHPDWDTSGTPITYSSEETYFNHDKWKYENPLGTSNSVDGQITEGMQHSAYLRLGLFVDTNPIVWEDEFYNGNSFGSATFGSGHKFNPWIGKNPDGEYSADRPEGVSKSRSWKKITELSLNVRQKGSYKIVGVVELKGRRRYNFSLKFRPAMTYGHVLKEQEGTGYEFISSYWEIDYYASGRTMTSPVDSTSGGGDPPTYGRWNPGWYWGQNSIYNVMKPVYEPTWGHAGDYTMLQSWQESYFYPGGDALVTNMIESSALSVEFFYGVTLSEHKDGARVLNDGTDPLGG